MRLLRLAWRNVFRQKRRTLTTLAALIIGLAGLVVFQGYLGQLMVGFRDSTIRSGIGHLQVSSDPKYFTDGEFNPFAYSLKDEQELTKTLAADPRVQAVFPSTGFTAIGGLGDKATTLLVKAYPADRMLFGPYPADTSGHFTLGELVAGTWNSSGAGDRLILGETAARILKAKVGDVVTLMAILPGGELNGRDFTVAGIYRSAGRDKIFAFTDYATARDFTHLTAAPVLHVLAHNPNQAAGIAALVSGHALKTWPELATYFVQVNTMFAGFLSVIRAILLLITLFILGNTMNRIVFERMREWGTLRAFGTKAREILGLVVLEGALQGLVGALLGIAAGFVISLFINLAGGIPFTDGTTVRQIKVIPDDQTVWWNLVPVIITAALAAFLPALRAMRLSPSEALRCP